MQRITGRGLVGGSIEFEAHAVCQPSEVVEDAHNVCHLQAAFVVQADFAQGLPILLHHAGGLPRELFGHRQERQLAVAEIRQISPTAFLDGVGEFDVRTFRTQKLCVTLCSVEAVLGGGRRTRDHFPLLTGEDTIGRKHNLGVELTQRCPKAWVRANQPRHRGDKTEIVGVIFVGPLRFRLARHLDPRLGLSLGYGAMSR